MCYAGPSTGVDKKNPAALRACDFTEEVMFMTVAGKSGTKKRSQQ